MRTSRELAGDMRPGSVRAPAGGRPRRRGGAASAYESAGTLLVLLTILTAGCAGGAANAEGPTGGPTPAEDPAGEPTDVAERAPAGRLPVLGDTAVVREAWSVEIDSSGAPGALAAWRTEDGPRLAATVSTRVRVLDAATGGTGMGGEGPVDLAGPEGIAVVGELAVVVEREAGRLRLYALPGWQSLGTAGEGVLRRPRGVVALPSGDAIEVFVTDDYGTAEGSIPPDTELGERVRHFRISGAWPRVGPEGTVVYVGAFGRTSPPGRLRRVESIAADPDRGELLVADEDRLTVERYAVDGRWLGTAVHEGLFRFEPDGPVLYRCGTDEGYWLAVDDDGGRSTVHVLDRRSFAALGRFRAATASDLGAPTLLQQSAGMPAQGGALFMAGDGGVAGFAWSEIAAALGLRADCGT